MGKAIGIDLGTTNSCAAVVENNQPKIIMYKGGNYTIPSMFAVDESGNKLVGHDAKKISQLNPAGTIYGSKRLLGRNYGSKTIEKVRQLFTYEILEGDQNEVLVKIKDQIFSLEQISAHILDKIREVSEEYLHDEISSAVITVPAYFNERQRQAVRNAGKMAKLNVIRILNEPTAAALAYGLGKNLNQKLAVYDLGGGTFDISIIEVKDKIFEVIATGGDTMLGGIDFDNRIMEWIISSFVQDHGIDLSNNIVAVQRIKESAERAKIDLSSLEETRINIPFIARGPKGTLNVDMTLTREKLEELTHDLVERTLNTCMRVLKEAKLELKDLDEVLLVGGQSRMPLVRRRVTDTFKRQPCKGVHPDEAVAVGAAIMAHSLTDQSYHKVELLDVLPMAIGIAKVDGTLLRLFPKFSPIPSYKSLILTNSKDNQKSIMLKIYQGDHEVAAENEILGTFIFSGIRKAKKGTVKVEVLFHIDSEGILTLSAKDKDTGQKMETVLKVKSTSEEGNGKKTTVKRTKGGKATVKTVKKRAARPASKSGAGKQTAGGGSGAGSGRTRTTARKKAPWETGAGAGSDLPPPVPKTPVREKWHDPAFDKATRELPKESVSKILAQARSEMEAAKAAKAASAPEPSQSKPPKAPEKREAVTPPPVEEEKKETAQAKPPVKSDQKKAGDAGATAKKAPRPAPGEGKKPARDHAKTPKKGPADADGAGKAQPADSALQRVEEPQSGLAGFLARIAAWFRSLWRTLTGGR